RALRGVRQSFECACELEQRRGARSIVVRAMKYLLVLAARKPSVPPEMIPVSAVDHELSRERRVRACERPDHVVRFDVAPAILDGEMDAGVHHHRSKAARDGRLLHRL